MLKGFKTMPAWEFLYGRVEATKGAAVKWLTDGVEDWN